MKKIIIQILLAAAALYLGYMCYQSVQNPIQFQKLKKQRYDRVIQKLKDIRTAQMLSKVSMEHTLVVSIH